MEKAEGRVAMRRRHGRAASARGGLGLTAIVLLAFLQSLVVSVAPANAGTPAVPAGTEPVSVSVVGNRLVNAAGATTRLLGVNRSGSEYACEQGWGIFDGPTDAASVAAMAGWHINAVRIPLNEGCWLDEYTGANDPYAQFGDPTPYEGANYQAAIRSYVDLLHSYGIAAILTLSVLDAPDTTYSPKFWTSVASSFDTDPGVLFDLYNEPHSITWPCWESGCTVVTADGTYQATGMQQLVNAIRGTGATQPIMLGGLAYSSDVSSWLSSLPDDPDHSLVVSFHSYDTHGCDTSKCWTDTVRPLAATVPVVTGEFGEYDCSSKYSNKYMKFADKAGLSYLGWAWDAISPGSWQCTTPALIVNYGGTPSRAGNGLHSHLASLAKKGLLPAMP
jgi:hypothetical protein